MSTPQQLLDIDDALVSDSNPARADGPLDYERCARLHNYLVAYGWMTYHGREVQDLNELLSRPSFFEHDHYMQDVPIDRLDPALVSFLESIITPDHDHGYGIFYWVNGVAVTPTDEHFLSEENELINKERFVTIYDTCSEHGPHTVGLVFDQQHHRAAMPLTIWNIDSISPHLDMWYPLETILSNWIHMIHIGKVTVGPLDSWAPGQIGPWRWQSYGPGQVESAVAAMDRLSAAIEARMLPESLLPVSRDMPLFTDAELDAASIPEGCFIRSVLTRVKTPRFKSIAPGLEVPHDALEFAARQKFTSLPRNYTEGGMDIPSVLIFAAADSSQTVNFNQEIRRQFFTANDPVPYDDHQPIPVGLYSESVQRNHRDIAEEGFRLLLPFRLRLHGWDPGPAKSDGSLVAPGSVMELFQHGNYYPFGGEWRAQRLERLLDRWRELVESGVWIVGKDGVEGDIDQFRDAGAWGDYWIAPDW